MHLALYYTVLAVAACFHSTASLFGCRVSPLLYRLTLSALYLYTVCIVFTICLSYYMYYHHLSSYLSLPFLSLFFSIFSPLVCHTILSTFPLYHFYYILLLSFFTPPLLWSTAISVLPLQYLFLSISSLFFHLSFLPKFLFCLKQSLSSS